MALITKIREKSGIAAAAIAISLILFLIGGDIFQGRSSFFGGAKDAVGEIGGETIKYQDFQNKVDEITQQYQQQSGRSPGEQEVSMIRDQVWNQYILDLAYGKEYETLGLTVSPAELVDMVQGTNIHPSVRQQFTNPQTGQFDKNYVIQFLKNFKTLPAAQQQAWVNFEKSLSQDRLRLKYENLLKMSTYTTNVEAQKDYVAQTSKVDARYLYVPFYSVADSTIKVTDAQLEEYLSSHKDLFQGQTTRSIQYVTFPVIPSKLDTASFYNDLKRLAKELAIAKNDSAFAMMNSDVKTPYYSTLAEIPEAVKGQLGNMTPGGIYGPFKNGLTYSIYKYGGIQKDSLFTVRASHILINAPKDASDSVKATARKRAEGILAQIKGGASFEAMAQQFGTDGTAQQGGDLGYFKNNGGMVKPFENAVFAFSGTGLLPSIVETDFGYHIVKVTEAKTNTRYKLAAINRTIAPSQSTMDEVLRKADAFAAENTTKEAFEASLKKDKTLLMLRGDRIPEGASSFNNLQNARDIVRWAFNDDTKVGSVSDVFQNDNQYIVALVTGSTDKEKVKVDDFREELTARVKGDLKAEQIEKKLAGISGTLEQIAQKYGAGALVETATDITLAQGVLTSAGADPTAIGKAFGLKVGKRSKPFKGEGGVFIMETTKSTPAPAIADLTLYKNTAKMMAGQRTSFYINEAIKENAKVVDNRAKFF
ncbi:peptidylprolyl isomerase [Arcicella rosea]|uniref:Periplasmic chaperone PpiD n=1 Tax=Arcicella rosea TaxID=502909 RepID=A0A841EJ89_9BACT|nr:peptidylprolyl isomerase [Arcicella rosea]MBB6003235.1 peptidyl-prolyl cis-trans isomerase D [Arcicella rosea]